MGKREEIENARETEKCIQEALPRARALWKMASQYKTGIHGLLEELRRFAELQDSSITFRLFLATTLIETTPAGYENVDIYSLLGLGWKLVDSPDGVTEFQAISLSSQRG